MKRVVNFLLFVLLISNNSALNAYDPATHREIAQRAATATISSLDQVLKSELGLSEGIRVTFPGISESGLRSIQQLIGDGAVFEDGSRRFFNHFHNPLRPWDQAGLRILGVQVGQSSLLWQQNLSQSSSTVITPLPLSSGGENWSWQDARKYYLDALTLPKKTDPDPKKESRDKAFARAFEALGGLTHLLQDASVPAHVRNDPHPSVTLFGRKLGNPDWYEDWVTETRTGDPDLFQSLLTQYDKNLHRPPFSIFAPTSNSQAPVPIARLMDTDKFLRLNFSVLTDIGLGITEYTNGNFLSRDTIFTDFDLPRQSSLDPNFRVEPFGSKFRRYLRKVSEGELPIDHFVTESLLHESIKDALGAGPLPAAAWYLDDRVHEDYAQRLLPRAVGYSAGLLDYFFRGKLDVDLVPDPNSSDPTVVKLSGTNGSPDKLDGGTLTLYADDPITGERILVPALEPNFTVTADTGQPVESAKFQINAEAERFMAVYKGKLGNEAPQGDFPGGVIGKVLGGVRAESIFFDFDTFKQALRTADGVFALPPQAGGLFNIQWGDQDDTFVGTSFSNDPNFPLQFKAFKVNREPGSLKPLLVPGPDGTPVVSVDLLKAVNFPFGLSLDVTVNYSQSFRVKQLLLTFDVTDTLVWKAPNYEFSSRQVTTPTSEVVVDKTVTFAQSFPIVLDRAHIFAFLPRPYQWLIEEVGLDNQGRLLALVKVILTELDNNVQTVNFRERDATTGQLFETPFDEFGSNFSSRVVGNFEVSDLLWALIDIEKGEVLGVTSSSTVSLSFQHTISRSILQRHQKTIFTGGGSRPDFEAKPPESWGTVRFANANPNYITLETGTITFPTAGPLSEALSGHIRADLDFLVSTPAISTQTFETPVVYFVDDVTKTNKGFRSISTNSFRSGTRTFLSDPRRVRSATDGAPDLIILVIRGDLQGITTKDALLAHWSPQFPSNTSLAFPEKLPPAAFYNLGSATSEASLIDTIENFTDFKQSTLLVDFANKKIQTFSTLSIFHYVLLEPKFLYNFVDTKFHTLDPSLRQTVLPRALASAPGFFPSPFWAYHLVRLP